MSRAELDQIWEHLERIRLERGRTEEALFAPLVLNLADLSSTTWKSFSVGQGFGLVFPAGTAGPLFQLQGRGIGFTPRFAPGDAIRGFFEEVQVKLSPTSPTSGTVTLLVVISPFAQFLQAPGTVAGAVQEATYTQVYNSAAGNVPTLSTQGISLEGVKGFDVCIEPVMGIVAGGDVRLWMYNGSNSRWAYTDVVYTPTPSIGTGPQSWEGPGELVAVPAVGKRVYAECVNMTLSTGAANIPVRLRTFG